MAAANIIREVPCPECGDHIQVEFAIKMDLGPGGEFSVSGHIVGSPLADHVCERHPDLLD